MLSGSILQALVFLLRPGRHLSLAMLGAQDGESLSWVISGTADQAFVGKVAGAALTFPPIPSVADLVVGVRLNWSIVAGRLRLGVG